MLIYSMPSKKSSTHWSLEVSCRCIEDDNRFKFLTEIKNVGKPDVEIDVKYSERDQTVRYGLLAISALSYTEKHLIEKIIYMEIDWYL
jgi:hypothetical protein